MLLHQESRLINAPLRVEATHSRQVFDIETRIGMYFHVIKRFGSFTRSCKERSIILRRESSQHRETLQVMPATTLFRDLVLIIATIVVVIPSCCSRFSPSIPDWYIGPQRDTKLTLGKNTPVRSVSSKCGGASMLLLIDFNRASSLNTNWSTPLCRTLIFSGACGGFGRASREIPGKA